MSSYTSRKSPRCSWHHPTRRTRWRWRSWLMMRTSAAYSFRPCVEPLDTLLIATANPSSLRNPRYTPPKPPCPSFLSSEKFFVAAARSLYRNRLGPLSTKNSSSASSSYPISSSMPPPASSPAFLHCVTNQSTPATTSTRSKPHNPNTTHRITVSSLGSMLEVNSQYSTWCSSAASPVVAEKPTATASGRYSIRSTEYQRRASVGAASP
uniref:Uncharacterized protein n=1 Tax=Oryza brachyantha TaxID=4533 RepID=J3L4N6_ORYBR